MEREEDDIQAAGDGLAGSHRSADFGGAGEEDENVAAVIFGDQLFNRLSHLVFERRCGVGGVGDGEGKETAFGSENGGVVEVAGDGRGVERGGHDDQFEVGTGGGLEAAEEGESEVGIEVAFVKFVEDDDAGVAEEGVGEKAAVEDAFGDESDAGAGAGDVFEADLVADGVAELFA